MNSGSIQCDPIEVGLAIVLRGDPRCGIHSPDNPQILIAQRLPTSVCGGFWEFPGGKLEIGEEIPACIAREAREELGIEADVLTVLPPIIHTYDHATVRLHPGVCRLAPGSPKPRNLHVAAHAWRRLDELPWEEFLPANIRVVTALRRHLVNGSSRR